MRTRIQTLLHTYKHISTAMHTHICNTSYTCSSGPSMVPVCALRTIEGNNRTIAAYGTTPHTATAGYSHACQAVSHFTSTIVSNRHYEGTTTVVPGTFKYFRVTYTYTYIPYSYKVYYYVKIAHFWGGGHAALRRASFFFLASSATG